MKNFILPILLLSLSILGQKKEKSNITFIGINKSDFDQEVIFHFKSIVGLHGYYQPITKIIPAKRKIEFVMLTFSHGKYSYNYSYVFNSKPTKEQKIAWNNKIAPYIFNEGSKLEKGIVIFSKEECSRCRFTKDYLIKNNIDFQFINITNNKKNEALMWKTIRDNDKNLKGVSTPVILIDGELYYKIKNLKGFLKTLKKRF